MNILISLLFSLFLFFGGKAVSTTADERVLAHIEIVQIGEGVYIRTSYDSRVFSTECSVKYVIAKDFLKTCGEPPITTKTKKL